jgi:hypothetical protein
VASILLSGQKAKFPNAVFYGSGLLITVIAKLLATEVASFSYSLNDLGQVLNEWSEEKERLPLKDACN